MDTLKGLAAMYKKVLVSALLVGASTAVASFQTNPVGSWKVHAALGASAALAYLTGLLQRGPGQAPSQGMGASNQPLPQK